MIDLVQRSAISIGETFWFLILFFGLVLAASLISPAFLTFDNLQNVIRAITVIGIISLGMSLVMIAGEIDLSVGSVAAFAGMAGAQFVDGDSSLVVISVTLGAGLVAGLINGLGVAVFGVSSLIMTLGTLAIARALGNVISRGQAAYPTNLEFYMFLARGKILGMPVPIIIFLIVVAGVWALVRFFSFGRKLYAVGSNPRAAGLSGINSRLIKIQVFTLSGLFAAIANLLQSGRLGQIDPAMGGGYELTAIAIAVLGGASLFGGRGTIEGTLIAALIIGVLNNLLNLLGVSIYIQQVVVAGIIVSIVYLNGLRADQQ
ncbi:MAG: ABC transporter permease [Hyphomicrobiales bacterium]|nr:ABC transporter permease [Hyphomicrobiales bacterium]